MLIREVMVGLKVQIIIQIMYDSIYYYLLHYSIKTHLMIFISLENNILIGINLFLFSDIALAVKDISFSLSLSLARSSFDYKAHNTIDAFM